jgi:hypothetical protein
MQSLHYLYETLFPLIKSKDRQHNGQKRKDKQRSHLAVSLFNVPDCGILSTISRYFSDFRDALGILDLRLLITPLVS